MGILISKFFAVFILFPNIRYWQKLLLMSSNTEFMSSEINTGDSGITKRSVLLVCSETV